MKRSGSAVGVGRMRTGIAGFDGLLGGGLPRDRTTLVVAETNAHIVTLRHELAGREAAVLEFSADASRAAAEVQDRGADERRLRRGDAESPSARKRNS